jgi:hypothetical protein
MSDQSRGSGALPVGAVIQRVAGHLLEQPRNKAQKLCWAWTQAVGAQVAQHSEPARLANGLLTVRVDSPVWNSQLHHLKEELLAKLQALLPPDTVRDLRFRQASLHTLPAWLQPKPTEPPLPPPHPEDEESADGLVAQVEDPELRAVLRQLVLTHMTRKRLRP